MKSPYGARGAICAQYGWTWQYLHWGIRWPIVQRILIDAPSYDHEATDEKDGEEKVQKLTAQTAKDILSKL